MSYREVKKVPFFFFVSSFLFASFAEKVPLGRDRHLCIPLPLHLLCWVGPSPVHSGGYIALATKAEREIARLLMRVKKKAIGENIAGR